MYLNKIKLNFFYVSVLTSFLARGVQERDWLNYWPTEPLKQTEKLEPVKFDKISDYRPSITYTLDRGRFGDQLVTYIKALWVSWKYELPFLYNRFDFSDQLALSVTHKDHFNQTALNPFSKKIEFIYDSKEAEHLFEQLDRQDKQKSKAAHSTEQLLWIIAYLTPFVERHRDEKLDDENFRTVLKDLVKPLTPVESINFPENHITVALHVRTGAGYDLQINIDKMPTKFPSDSFYLNSLKQVAEHFKGQPLYVRIFTDDPNPTAIKDRYVSKLKEWKIENPVIMECRTSSNGYDLNVLEDFFAMMQFDCLIRPDSNFSRGISLVAAPVIEARPTNWLDYRKDENGEPIKDRDGKLIVDPQIMYRSAKGKNIIERRSAHIDDSMLFN